MPEGLAVLSDAFILLKKKPEFKNLQLYLTGGYTGDDVKDIKKMQKKMQVANISEDVKIFEEFDRAHRIEFLKKLSVLSVPVLAGEAFGAYQVEALAAGVPIVQPNVGGYPEFVQATGGGLIYEPNEPQALANALEKMLSDPEKWKAVGQKGRDTVFEKYTMNNMAKSIIDVYKDIVQ